MSGDACRIMVEKQKASIQETIPACIFPLLSFPDSFYAVTNTCADIKAQLGPGFH